MAIVIFGMAVLTSLLYIILLHGMSEEDLKTALYNKILDHQNEAKKLSEKVVKNQNKIENTQGLSKFLLSLFLKRNFDKKINKILKENEKLKSGDIGKISVLNMPGYVLVRKWEVLGKSDFHKKLLTLCNEVYGRKYGNIRALKIMADMFSYALLVASVTLIVASLSAASNPGNGIFIAFLGLGLAGIIAYATYEEVKSKAEKRIKSIRRQFPNIASKLALLVTSGMVMDRAWKLTAYSNNTELYLEMQKTSKELDNLIPPKVAYGEFINRCNSKETTSLASAILQNMSKGNAEIGRLLNKIAQSAWLERRHMAKRDSENATSQLMIPTIILFMSIMLMIMAPIAMNMSGL